jgi:CDP-paratose 2-epimerase
MKRILISGICGFVGSTIALRLRQVGARVGIVGFDNFIRAGSELNRLVLKRTASLRGTRTRGAALGLQLDHAGGGHSQ